jgi:hypothetical protein
MNSQEPLSITDGFLYTVLGSVPLWATAAFPYTSRPVKNICMVVSGLVVLNWLVLPVGRWLWKRLRSVNSRLQLAARYPRAS